MSDNGLQERYEQWLSAASGGGLDQETTGETDRKERSTRKGELIACTLAEPAVASAETSAAAIANPVIVTSAAVSASVAAPAPTARRARARHGVKSKEEIYGSPRGMQFSMLFTKKKMTIGDKLCIPVSGIPPGNDSTTNGWAILEILSRYGRKSSWALTCDAMKIRNAPLEVTGPAEFDSEMQALRLKGPPVLGAPEKLWVNNVWIYANGRCSGTVSQVKKVTFDEEE